MYVCAKLQQKQNLNNYNLGAVRKSFAFSVESKMTPKNRLVLTSNYVNEYFSHLNPIAIKIASDIMDTKLSYGSFWHTMNDNEQTEILNEALIKPEISLRYFYNTTSSICAMHLHGSSPSEKAPLSPNAKINDKNTNKKRFSSDDSDSLTSVVFNGLNNKICRDLEACSNNGNTQDIPENNIKQEKLMKHVKEKQTSLNNAQCNYAYDGRNLKTYAVHEVALKVIYDDLSGYRDEHSQPFSYRTKSQINFQLFNNNIPKNASKLNTYTNSNYNATEVDLRILNKINVMTDPGIQSRKLTKLCKKKTQDDHKGNATIVSCYEDDDSVALLTVTDNKRCSGYTDYCSKITNFITNSELKHFKSDTSFEQLGNNISNSDNVKRNSFANYKVSLTKTKVSPIIIEQYFSEENKNDRDLSYISNDSSVFDPNYNISEQEEKTLSEETKLLDNDEVTLKRGFDFLNNW